MHARLPSFLPTLYPSAHFYLNRALFYLKLALTQNHSHDRNEKENVQFEQITESNSFKYDFIHSALPATELLTGISYGQVLCQLVPVNDEATKFLEHVSMESRHQYIDDVFIVLTSSNIVTVFFIYLFICIQVL